MAARKLIHRFIGAGIRNRVAMFLSFAAKKPSVVQSFTLSSNCLLGIWALFLQMGVEESQFANQIGILFPLLLQFTMQTLFILKGAWVSVSLFFYSTCSIDSRHSNGRNMMWREQTIKTLVTDQIEVIALSILPNNPLAGRPQAIIIRVHDILIFLEKVIWKWGMVDQSQ